MGWRERLNEQARAFEMVATEEIRTQVEIIRFNIDQWQPSPCPPKEEFQ